MSLNKIVLLLSIYFSVVTNSFGFKIDPYSDYEPKLNIYPKRDVEIASYPRHENFLVRSLDGVKIDLLNGSKIKILEGLVKGVRWNDDPLSTLRNHTVNFLINFEHSCDDERVRKIDNNWDYSYRTHCGDMQYLHAMRSKINESREETLSKIMMWMEFAYKVSTGEIPVNRRLRSVHKLLTKDSNKLFYKEILNEGTKYSCKKDENDNENGCAEVETLFSFECKRGLDFPQFWKTKDYCEEIGDIEKEIIRNIALGSALHVLQDSMSDSHVERFGKNYEFCSPENREVGVIKYNYYNEQNSSNHGKADKEICSNSKGELNIIDMGKKLITWSFRDRKNKTRSWNSEVNDYLRYKVFLPSDIKSTASNKYKK